MKYCNFTIFDLENRETNGYSIKMTWDLTKSKEKVVKFINLTIILRIQRINLKNVFV